MQKQRKHNTNTVATKGRQELVRVGGERVISFIVLVVKQRTINWPTTRTTTGMIIMMKYMKFLIFIGDIWLRAKEEMRRGEGEQAMLFNFETSALSLSLSLASIGWPSEIQPFLQSVQSEQSAPQALVLSLKTNIEHYVNRRCHFQVCQLQIPVFAGGIWVAQGGGGPPSVLEMVAWMSDGVSIAVKEFDWWLQGLREFHRSTVNGKWERQLQLQLRMLKGTERYVGLTGF